MVVTSKYWATGVAHHVHSNTPSCPELVRHKNGRYYTELRQVVRIKTASYAEMRKSGTSDNGSYAELRRVVLIT